MDKSYVCEPSTPHESRSTPGREHVDFQHKEVYRNGVTRNAGRCEGNQHDTGSWVDTVREFFGSKK